MWDALALKGSCHIWIDGEGECATEGAVTFGLWGSEEAPEAPIAQKVYVLTCDCPGINPAAVTGDMWQWSGTEWVQYSGVYMATA